MQEGGIRPDRRHAIGLHPWAERNKPRVKHDPSTEAFLGFFSKIKGQALPQCPCSLTCAHFRACGHSFGFIHGKGIFLLIMVEQKVTRGNIAAETRIVGRHSCLFFDDCLTQRKLLLMLSMSYG